MGPNTSRRPQSITGTIWAHRQPTEQSTGVSQHGTRLYMPTDVGQTPPHTSLRRKCPASPPTREIIALSHEHIRRKRQKVGTRHDTTPGTHGRTGTCCVLCKCFFQHANHAEQSGAGKLLPKYLLQCISNGRRDRLRAQRPFQEILRLQVLQRPGKRWETRCRCTL